MPGHDFIIGIDAMPNHTPHHKKKEEINLFYTKLKNYMYANGGD